MLFVTFIVQKYTVTLFVVIQHYLCCNVICIYWYNVMHLFYLLYILLQHYFVLQDYVSATLFGITKLYCNIF